MVDPTEQSCGQRKQDELCGGEPRLSGHTHAHPRWYHFLMTKESNYTCLLQEGNTPGIHPDEEIWTLK
ncbi:unnamed protein product [Urochloa humidicola]